ncbi:NADPH:quinone reductase [Aphelenchoides fujianensis]|nr:NADPH:quinone reductase [Aphelenchoides fujianensis]
MPAAAAARLLFAGRSVRLVVGDQTARRGTLSFAFRSFLLRNSSVPIAREQIRPLHASRFAPSAAMRAALVREFGGEEKINVEEVPPPLAGEKQVLIRVKAAGVNPVDTYIRSGTYALKPELPYVPGREGAGVVEQVGPNVQQFKPGDRVWFAALRNGAAAEFAAIDADFFFRLPDRVSFAQGATLGIAYFTAYRALFLKAGAQAGQSLFVHGASGGVGLAACQLAKSHGLRVFGTASTPEGEALAREHGCEEVFNHREEGYVERIRERYPLGFDIIVEMLANVNLCADLQLIAPQGRIVVVGNRGTIEIDPRQCMQKEAAIIGLMASVTTPEDYQRMGERVVGLLEGGHVTPNVGQTFPLEQLGEAHRRILEPGARGKIVVLITPDAEVEAAGEGEPQPQPQQQ